MSDKPMRDRIPSRGGAVSDTDYLRSLGRDDPEFITAADEIDQLREANERLALRAALAKDHLLLLRQRIETLCARHSNALATVSGNGWAVVSVDAVRAALAGAAPAEEQR